MNWAISTPRAVDWRWRRVLQLAAGECIVSATDDPLIEAASRTVQRRASVDPSHDPILSAVKFAHDEKFSRLRAMVEARILARQSLATIAERTGVRRETAAWFMALFFDVSEALACPDTIFELAIAPSNQHGASDTRARAIKVVGYVCGGDVLDRLTLATAATSRLSLSQLRDAVGEQCSAVVAQSLWELAQGVHGDDAKAQVQTLKALMREQSSASDGSGIDAGIFENIQAMMRYLPWQIGEYPEDENFDLVRPVLPNGAELTSAELFRTSLGLPVDGLEHAEQLRFPDSAENPHSESHGG